MALFWMASTLTAFTHASSSITPAFLYWGRNGRRGRDRDKERERKRAIRTDKAQAQHKENVRNQWGLHWLFPPGVIIWTDVFHHVSFSLCAPDIIIRLLILVHVVIRHLGRSLSLRATWFFQGSPGFSPSSSSNEVETWVEVQQCSLTHPTHSYPHCLLTKLQFIFEWPCRVEIM